MPPHRPRGRPSRRACRNARRDARPCGRLIAAVPHMGEDFRAAEGMLGRVPGPGALRCCACSSCSSASGAAWNGCFGARRPASTPASGMLRLETIGERLRVAVALRLRGGPRAELRRGQRRGLPGLRLAPSPQGASARVTSWLPSAQRPDTGRFLLAPGRRRGADVSRFRIVPMTTTAARFWHSAHRLDGRLGRLRPGAHRRLRAFRRFVGDTRPRRRARASSCFPIAAMPFGERLLRPSPPRRRARRTASPARQGGRAELLLRVLGCCGSAAR